MRLFFINLQFLPINNEVKELTQSQYLDLINNLWRVFYYLVILLFFSNKVFIYP